MSETLPPIRRIVTEDDARGRSRIADDAPAQAVRTVAGRPGYRSVNLWRTESAPAPVGAADSIAAHQGILPPKQGGSILRIIDFPPESADPAERRRQIQATFTGMFADAQHDKREGAHLLCAAGRQPLASSPAPAATGRAAPSPGFRAWRASGCTRFSPRLR
jgi:hypothetical protein